MAAVFPSLHAPPRDRCGTGVSAWRNRLRHSPTHVLAIDAVFYAAKNLLHFAGADAIRYCVANVTLFEVTPLIRTCRGVVPLGDIPDGSLKFN